MNCTGIWVNDSRQICQELNVLTNVPKNPTNSCSFFHFQTILTHDINFLNPHPGKTVRIINITKYISYFLLIPWSDRTGIRQLSYPVTVRPISNVFYSLELHRISGRDRTNQFLIKRRHFIYFCNNKKKKNYHG